MRRKRSYRVKPDPRRDLAGATPEALVRALFRRTEQPTPSTRQPAVEGGELPVREPAPD